jgi:hypothetical protein
MPSVITVEIADGFILSVMFPRETCFFGAHVSVCKTVGVPSVGVFLFATDLATEMGVTDDWYTDGRVPSMRPSVIISPTDFIPITDGISLSVKLFNGVVFKLKFILLIHKNICEAIHLVYMSRIPSSNVILIQNIRTFSFYSFGYIRY